MGSSSLEGIAGAITCKRGVCDDVVATWKCVCRFAAVRTLNKVAMSHPMAVTNCNIDMESLISDQNRSIATLAITTLLKTGNESSVDRLLKQVKYTCLDDASCGPNYAIYTYCSVKALHVVHNQVAQPQMSRSNKSNKMLLCVLPVFGAVWVLPKKDMQVQVYVTVGANQRMQATSICTAYRSWCCALQIGTFMTDIADEFKIVVVEAIRSLCLKFPQKYRALMNFLSGVLREDGGFEYKKAIVDSILILIREIPDAKESGLAHLCEFIEVSRSQATWSHALQHLNTKPAV